MSTIVFTGGGTAGHVIPNLVVFQALEGSWSAHYIGSRDGIERNLVGEKMPYHAISSGKLRRYFDFKNFTDIFRVFWGALQSLILLQKLKPSLIFSKGGFVSVPVVLAGWLHRVPIILHEADITPGLANRLTTPFATKICVSFAETLSHLPAGKAVHTGIPIRQELLTGDVEKGFSLTGFHREKPVLLAMGGSLGAEFLNQNLRGALESLLPTFQIIHLCGKGKLDQNKISIEGYRQYEFVSEELPHLLAITSIFLSRAGANSIFELLALQKPHLLIPLSLKASRGDQILNARSFEKQGYSRVLQEERLTEHTLVSELQNLWENRQSYIQAMRKSPLSDATQQILKIIESTKMY